MDLATVAGAGCWEGPGAGILPADAPTLRLPRSKSCGPAAWDLGPCQVAAGTAGRTAAPPSRRGSHGDGGGDPAGLQAAGHGLGREAPGVGEGGPCGPRRPGLLARCLLPEGNETRN